MNARPSPDAARPGARLPGTTFWGFLTAVTAVFVIAGLAYRSNQIQSEGAERLVRSLRLVTQIDDVLSTMKDAETGQRGYLLTGNLTYLEPNLRANERLPAQLQSLGQLLGDDPVQQDRLKQLSRLCTDKIAELNETIALRRAGNEQAALAVVVTDRGKNIMDQIRTTVRDMGDAERTTAEERTARWRDQSEKTTLTILGGSALLLFLMMVSATVTARDFKVRATHSWLRSGESGLSGSVLGARSEVDLAQKALSYIAQYLGAPVGALYVLEEEGVLRRLASYAASGEHLPSPEHFAKGEGLLGQVVANERAIHLEDVPRDYLRIGSAVGTRGPTEVLAFPLRAELAVNGVVELGFFRKLEPFDLEFAERIAEIAGIALRTARYRSRLENLLEETQRQAEELQTQQEELRVSNEELEEHAQLLERQKNEVLRTQLEIGEKNSELERTNRYKSEFLANMSHELRTPLNSSLILSKVLAENRGGNLTPEQVRFAETIYGAGNDLLTLINDVLDLAKVEAGRIELRPEPVVLARVVDGLTQIFQPLAEQKKLEFVVKLAPDCPTTIETDRQRLDQILKNLLSNAFKFTEHGTVSLEIFSLDAHDIALAVRDTGIGIPKDKHDIIFDAFRQLESTTSRKYGGTGLGLSISKELARLLGGEIRLESTPGQGSVFTLVVPRKHAPAASPSPERTSPAAAPSRIRDRLLVVSKHASVVDVAKPRSLARRLLIVEDDASFATVLCELGQELRFECVVAETADEAIRQALAEPPMAVVLDIGLPDHSGLSVLDQLKRSPATRHVPVHVISAKDYGQAVMEMGAVGYALKPVKREEISRALQQLAVKAEQTLRRILIVEDDLRQREAVVSLLTTDEVETVAVATVADALEQLQKVTFDCMVMDLNLPGASGYELLDAMAQGEQYAFPPVIVYTGRSLDPEEEARLRRYSRSIIIKGAKSPERLLDEVTLFLHQVESELPANHQKLLRQARDRDSLFEGRRILIVEDDVRNIFALTSVLEPKGATIDVARNGQEAVNRLKVEPRVDLVLMDIMMPEMDGYEAMRAIRKNPSAPKLPIIALTAKAMPDDQEKCLAAGANDYVAKPIDVDKLLSLIRVWIPK